MLTNILQHDDPILRQVAKEIPIAQIPTQYIQELIESMKKIMRAAPGVGLAAPQVGISLQLAVIEDREEYAAAMLPEIREERGRTSIPFHVIINPKLTVISSEQVQYFEACLSVRGVSRITPRAKNVMVECYDENGDKKIIYAGGWYARILQHEIDHLNGKLYVDLSDPATEILNDEINRKKWLNATSVDVNKYLQASKLGNFKN